MTPEEIQSVMDRLEAHVVHPGTIAIHDPLYRMLRDPEGDHLPALLLALAAHPSHPLHDTLSTLIGDYAVPLPTLVEVLLAHGPMAPDVDPVLEVRQRLRRSDEVRRILEDRIALLDRQASGLARTASLMAAAASLAALLGLLGWLAALGLWEIDWQEPLPSPDDPGEAGEAQG